MLSEGRPGIDNVFSLREGVLRLEIDKPTFERMGLDGRAIPTEGRKHIKARYGMSFERSGGGTPNCSPSVSGRGQSTLAVYGTRQEGV